MLGKRQRDEPAGRPWGQPDACMPTCSALEANARLYAEMMKRKGFHGGEEGLSRTPHRRKGRPDETQHDHSMPRIGDVERNHLMQTSLLFLALQRQVKDALAMRHERDRRHREISKEIAQRNPIPVGQVQNSQRTKDNVEMQSCETAEMRFLFSELLPRLQEQQRKLPFEMNENVKSYQKSDADFAFRKSLSRLQGMARELDSRCIEPPPAQTENRHCAKSTSVLPSSAGHVLQDEGNPLFKLILPKRRRVVAQEASHKASQLQILAMRHSVENLVCDGF